MRAKKWPIYFRSQCWWPWQGQFQWFGRDRDPIFMGWQENKKRENKDNDNHRPYIWDFEGFFHSQGVAKRRKSRRMRGGQTKENVFLFCLGANNRSIYSLKHSMPGLSYRLFHMSSLPGISNVHSHFSPGFSFCLLGLIYNTHPLWSFSHPRKLWEVSCSLVTSVVQSLYISDHYLFQPASGNLTFYIS